MLKFKQLVSFLEKHGYTVKVTTHKSVPPKNIIYSFAMIENSKNITAGFCTPTYGESYRYIDNRIAADNSHCFDKWSKCPLVMQLPVNGEELLEHLIWLGSDEGYNYSNSYGYLDEGEKRFPYEI